MDKEAYFLLDFLEFEANTRANREALEQEGGYNRFCLNARRWKPHGAAQACELLRVTGERKGETNQSCEYKRESMSGISLSQELITSKSDF